MGTKNNLGSWRFPRGQNASWGSASHLVPRHHKSEYPWVKLVTRPSPRSHPTYSSSRLSNDANFTVINIIRTS
jgi:hypothetical protein